MIAQLRPPGSSRIAAGGSSHIAAGSIDRQGSRRGGVLILIAMMLFAVLAITGLLIDVAMARLTQSNMQSIADSAALEGGWQLAIGSDTSDLRQAVVERSSSEGRSWGQRRIELEDGFDLDEDGRLESSQTIDRETIGQDISPALNPNVDNLAGGDIVMGHYDAKLVPDQLPRQPVGFDRGEAFVPRTIQSNAVLVRLRRTGEEEIEGGTSAPRVPYLWSRGSLIDIGLKGRGMSVRSESIAALSPVVAIGSAIDDALPTVLDAAIPLTEIKNETFARDSLIAAEDARQIGVVVPGGDVPQTFTGVGYLPIVEPIDDGSGKVIGFIFAAVTTTDISPTTPTEEGFLFTGATSDLRNLSEIDNDALIANQQLEGPSIARAPKMVRGRHIHGVSP